MVVIKIEIISDIVCVWCFIGKRTVEKAISLYQKTYPGGKNDTFSIVWRPYYLNYNRSVESIEKAELTKVKFQGVPPEKMAAMENRVNQIAAANGIKFNFKGKIGSTRDAHRLIYLSQLNASPDVQNALVERLFQAYHEHAMDISDRKVLADIATDAGLDGPKAVDWLESGEDVEKVDDEARQNRQYVTTGVPTFFIQDEYRVDGAQDLQEFFEAFVKVKEDKELA